MNNMQTLKRLQALIDKRGVLSSNLTKAEQKEYDQLRAWYSENFREV